MFRNVPLFFWCFLAAFAVSLAGGCDVLQREKDIIGGDEDPLSIVNSKKIFLPEFQNNVRRLLDNNPAVRTIYEADPGKVKEIVINKMIEKELLLQEAVRRRVSISEEELATFTNNAVTPYVGAKTDLWLRKANLSREEWKKGYNEFLVIQRLTEREVNSRVEVSDLELKEYFAAHRDEFNRPKKYEVQHILVSSHETAKMILRKLKRGANFESLVNSHSIAADKTNGGHMGFISKGMLPAELEKGIFEIKRVGRFSQIVNSTHGLHIFKLLGTVRPKKARLRDVKDQVAARVREGKYNEAYSEWYRDLKEKAYVVVNQNLLLRDEGF